MRSHEEVDDLEAWLKEGYARSFRTACLILGNRSDAEEAVQRLVTRSSSEVPLDEILANGVRKQPDVAAFASIDGQKLFALTFQAGPAAGWAVHPQHAAHRGHPVGQPPQSRSGLGPVAGT